MDGEIRSWSELKTALAQEADEGYREFVMRGVPSERPFLGVRVPVIRRIVGRVALENAAQMLREQPVVFEEVLARGMLVCRLPYLEMLEQFDAQVKQIDDWCSCDTFSSEVSRLVREHRTEFWEQKIDPLLTSPREFAVRTALVIMKCGYLDFDHLGVIFDRVEGLAGREEYYVRMAIAWLLAECFIKFPDETGAYLAASRLPEWTLGKSISKICDSHRVAPEVKEYLRGRFRAEAGHKQRN